MASCVNTVNTIGQVYVAVTPYTGVSSLAAKQVCLGSVKRTTCTDFVANERVELLSNFSNNFPQPTTTLIAARQGRVVGGKTRNIALQPILQ